MTTRKPESAQPLTRSTGTFGDSAEGGWWAVRWSFDGLQGEGCGLTEADALAAAERDIEEQRALDHAVDLCLGALAAGERADRVEDRLVPARQPAALPLGLDLAPLDLVPSSQRKRVI